MPKNPHTIIKEILKCHFFDFKVAKVTFPFGDDEDGVCQYVIKFPEGRMTYHYFKDNKVNLIFELDGIDAMTYTIQGMPYEKTAGYLYLAAVMVEVHHENKEELLSAIHDKFAVKLSQEIPKQS